MANSASGDSVVDRVVRLLAAFPEGTPRLSLSDLAARAGLPLSSAHRLVRQMSDHGLLDVEEGGAVKPGLRLWELVSRNAPTLELRTVALPFMEDIQQVLRQNVNLAVLDGQDALFVERLSRPGSVTNRATVAGRLPVYISSAGLALMAFQPREVQAEYVTRQILAGAVPEDELRQRLAETARNGYAQLVGILDPETSGIAAPVLDPQGHAVAALGVVVPVTEVRLREIVAALQGAAQGVRRGLETIRRA
ncbi:DNA-binding IclR family transcriptional regulator [Arthrobacter woluwensis]|uniref:IclR family transcriptional regulator n=1 Tax=Arthrobacter woluwensis TaxID=156980 RepID=UPI0027887624|nr:IclR family transcriptional regulator [Arthrobacter woluwensis]MDQ0710058.1 DNA-binding IclR family transcriptional regulator [Arthrobacter woluwensis]